MEMSGVPVARSRPDINSNLRVHPRTVVARVSLFYRFIRTSLQEARRTRSACVMRRKKKPQHVFVEDD